MSETTGYPQGYCAKKARLSLNTTQWTAMAEEDEAKAHFTKTKAVRAKRQLDLHQAACPTCGGP